ncbi:MAG: TetR/AcrR family transcriptional regulator, partial [Coriobacteriales bacterium]|nr:TetR/AcrR family transcriptional regulator [Coriobacteriales bacterium]
MEAQDAIKEAFRGLVVQVPFAKITISGICGAANVSRRTFYRYFESKDDIIAALIQDDFVRPVETIAGLLPLDEIKSATRLMMERLHRTFFDNMEYYERLVSSIGTQGFIDAFVKEEGELNRQMYLEKGLSEIEAQFASDILCAAQAASLVWWLGHRELDYRQMADMNLKWIHVRLGESTGTNTWGGGGGGNEGAGLLRELPAR